jgi:ribosomal protein S18 acetylase RimI-like enzyme
LIARDSKTEIIMPFAIRHRDDPMTALTVLAGLSVEGEDSSEIMAALQGRPRSDIQSRFDDGHRAYVARIDGEPAAWGWVATREARIGELDTMVRLPDDERYLWNFVTLPPFRGRGVYPRLLQEVVRAESSSALRFWIAYAPENHASGAGIRKAGFTALAELSFDRQGRAALKSLAPDGARTVGRVLPLEEAAEVTPCWRCVRAGRPAMNCPEGHCQCDYQQPKSGCVA